MKDSPDIISSRAGDVVKVHLWKAKRADRGRVYLYLRFTLGGKRYTERTGISLVECSAGDRESKKENKKNLAIAEKMRQARQEQLEEIALDEFVPLSEKLKTELLDFFDRVKESKSNITWSNVDTYLRAYIGSQKLYLREITPKWLNSFQDYLLSIEWKSGRKLDPSTVAKYMDNLRTVIVAAINKGLLNTNPFRLEEYKRIKIPEKPINWLQPSTIKRLIQTDIPTHQKDVKEGFLFSIFSGLRAGDIANLRFGDLQEEMFSITQKKTRNVVYIPLVPCSKAIIERQRSKYPDWKKDTPVFDIGAINVLYKPLRRWIKETGVPDFTFHSARRTCATILYDNDVPERVIETLLGHVSDRKRGSSFGRYARPSFTKIQNALMILNEMFEAEIREWVHR